MSVRLPAGPPALLRRLNSAAILDMIRTQGPISRADLARATGLSKPTVKEVTESLLETGYVSEARPNQDGQSRRPGPRARLLRFQANLGYVMGIDIGADKILAMVADLDGRVVGSQRTRTSPQDRAQARSLLAKVWATAGAAVTEAGVSQNMVKAIAIGSPGVYDSSADAITLAPQIPAFEGIRLRASLSESVSSEVLVENEVHLSLLAERWQGAAQGDDDVLYVQIGVGIGGGILINGKIYSGATGAAGEIGYLPVADPDGTPHDMGAFEEAAGARAFARLGRKAAEAHPESALRSLSRGDLDTIDAKTVFEAAAGGDTAALRVLDKLFARLARGIAAAIVVLNPSMVIVGGGVSRAGQHLLEPLQGRIRQLVPVLPRIALSTLGDEAVALGGVRLALNTVEERLFRIPLVGSA
jgi:predicted NBD/HSP70 family sugar kinase